MKSISALPWQRSNANSVPALRRTVANPDTPSENASVGFVSWVLVSLLAFLAGRLIRPGRVRRWRDELFVALPAGILGGMIATSLDFGGWRELEWRSALFALLVAISAIAAVRLAGLSRSR